MVRRIEGNIVRAEVVGSGSTVEATHTSAVFPRAESDLPGVLQGTTYEIGAPGAEPPLHVTIRDVVLNAGTEQEVRRPFEISIDARGHEEGPWIIALARILSAVFRRGGDVRFLIDELRGVGDARGPESPVGAIADVLETHLRQAGLPPGAGPAPADGEFPGNAEVCGHCGIRSVVSLDGCLTCLACGDSRCG